MKRLMLATTLGAAMLAAGAATPAMAQSAAPAPGSDAPPSPLGHPRAFGGGLMHADLNHDGVVTRDEVIADADARFAARDRNGDGKIDRDEARAGRDAPPPPPHDMYGGPRHGRDDAGRGPDGRGGKRPPQTREAFRDHALRMFDRADTNHDGRVDRQEMDAMQLMMRARMAGRDDDRRGPPPPPEQTPPSDEQR